MGQRIKGQEVETSLVLSGNVIALTAARSMDVTFKLEKKEEGYLGETTQRYDTIFNGVEGKISYHFDNATPLAFILAIVDKAQRRTPGAIANVKCVMNFPDGSRARITIPNVEFGPMPLSFGARADYGTFEVDFSASKAVGVAI